MMTMGSDFNYQGNLKNIVFFKNFLCQDKFYRCQHVVQEPRQADQEYQHEQHTIWNASALFNTFLLPKG
jgi:hypothetical protein